MALTLTKAMVTKHRSALTRAKKSGDPRKVLAAANAALADFEEHGYPDAWHLWNVAKQDAEYAIAREEW